MPQVARDAGRMVAAAAAACQVATILVTWPLWQHRSSPPNLPAVEGLASFDYGLVLVAAAVAALAFPRAGAAVFAVLLAAAIAGDQIRLQPEVVSLAALMLLPVWGGEAGLAVSRFHLSSLWLWSGLNKLLSTGWAATGGAAEFIASSLGSRGLRPAVAIGLPLVELALAGTSLWRRTWPVARWLAPALHIGVLVTLSPLFADWNSAVWPWNVALAVAGFVLFQREAEAVRSPKWAVAAAGGVLLAYPALFYAGSVDAYLSHNLYTSNTPSAAVCEANGTCDGGLAFNTFGPLNVPIPPEPRLFRHLFHEVCRPGQQLLIVGRATVFTDPPSRTISPCP